MSDKVNEKSSGLFSHETDEWLTPDYVYNPLNEIYNFDVDVCATPANARCKKFFSKEDNGLSKAWSGKCWMNPPFGKELPLWMDKARQAVITGGADVVVCLVPARTDTRWFHDIAMDASEIWLVKGRISFNGANNNGKKYRYTAPFPSAIVIYRKDKVKSQCKFLTVRFEDNKIKFI